MAEQRRVFGLGEALWWDDIKGRDPVLPTLKILKRQRIIRFASRTVATEEEFRRN